MQRLAFIADCVDDTYLAAWLELDYSDARKWRGIHFNRATTNQPANDGHRSIGSRRRGVFTAVCLCVCFPHDMLETDAARITKRDKQKFHDKFWKPIYFLG